MNQTELWQLAESLRSKFGFIIGYTADPNKLELISQKEETYKLQLNPNGGRFKDVGVTDLVLTSTTTGQRNVWSALGLNQIVYPESINSVIKRWELKDG